MAKDSDSYSMDEHIQETGNTKKDKTDDDIDDYEDDKFEK